MGHELIPVPLPYPELPAEVRASLHDALARLWRGLEAKTSQRGYAADWRRFSLWVSGRGKSILEIRPADIETYLTWMAAEGLKKSTRSRALAVIRETYRALVAADLMPMNPAREAKNIKVSKEPTTPWLTESEAAALLRHDGDARDRLVVLVIIGTGLRRSNVGVIDCADLIPDTGVPERIRVTVKGGKDGFVKVPRWLGTAIDEWRRRENIPIGKLWKRRLSGTSIHAICKSYAASAGIDPSRATPHALRRTFVTLARQRGVSLEDLQSALLHSSKTTTERYDKMAHAAAEAPGEVFADLVGRRDDS